MGVYNTILVECPECGKEVEFQSKWGDCSLAVYKISRVPERDLAGIIGDVVECECGHLIEIGRKELFIDGSHLVR